MSDFQLPLFDLTTPVRVDKIRKMHSHKVFSTVADIRLLADELNKALYSCKAKERPIIHAPSDAFDLILPFVGYLDHEELWIILMNTRNAVIGMGKVYQGSANSAQVRVSELFRQAIIEMATSLIVVHNHPSGDPCPSPDDVSLTRAIVQAGKLLDIDVLDHLVIGSNTTERRMVSLKERGLGFS